LRYAKQAFAFSGLCQTCLARGLEKERPDPKDYRKADNALV